MRPASGYCKPLVSKTKNPILPPGWVGGGTLALAKNPNRSGPEGLTYSHHQWMEGTLKNTTLSKFRYTFGGNNVVHFVILLHRNVVSMMKNILHVKVSSIHLWVT